MQWVQHSLEAALGVPTIRGRRASATHIQFFCAQGGQPRPGRRLFRNGAVGGQISYHHFSWKIGRSTRWEMNSIKCFRLVKNEKLTWLHRKTRTMHRYLPRSTTLIRTLSRCSSRRRCRLRPLPRRAALGIRKIGHFCLLRLQQPSV